MILLATQNFPGAVKADAGALSFVVVLNDFLQKEEPLVRLLAKIMAVLQQGEQLGQHRLSCWVVIKVELFQQRCKSWYNVVCIFKPLPHLTARWSGRKAVQQWVGAHAHFTAVKFILFNFVSFN